jgi:FkbM family methyltransferase
LDTVAKQHPEIETFNFLNIDIQGNELAALKGATKLLTGPIRYVYLEINEAELYVGCPLGTSLIQIL